MDDEATYLEQFCMDCQDETDQQLSAETSTSTCLRCGRRNEVKGEAERLVAFLQRVRDQEMASISRLRETTVPAF
jgi:hypothetical protein